MSEIYRGEVEDAQINRIDQKRFRKEHGRELKGQGAATEQAVADFLDTQIPGLKSRFSTEREDQGKELGGKEIDIVAYLEDKPALAFQITSQFQKGELARKKEHARDYPFVRLDEMKTTDTSIPRVTLLLDAMAVSKFSKDPNFANHPELALRILNGITLNLEFALRKTANPAEQNAIKRLMPIFEDAKKKFVH